MGLRDLIVACTLLVLCSADQTLTTVNSMLDPNRITWWRTKWAASPIVLSINNRSKTSTTATFFISPTTSITSGVLEVTFPTGFTVPGSTGQIYTLTAQTYVGGQDYAVPFGGLTNPSTVGAYGPFALRTRYNSGGQQVDVNLNFGYVYIYGDAGTLGNLVVNLAGTTINNVINKSGNTLSFRFTIAQSLWKYDTFVINTDSRWTIASGATCSSADYSGKWNNFNGTNTANPHALQCFVTTKTTGNSQTVYIYGLAVDGADVVTTDNQSVDLRVTSVTTPDAVYVGSTYSWTVSTFRFQTATNLETATYSSGPVVTYDAITTASWAPTWGMATADVINLSTYFMDLSFTITNAIPASGSIDISVTEDVATGDPSWLSTVAIWGNCYVVTYISKTVACSTSASGSIQLTGLPALTAGYSIKLRNVVKFQRSSGDAVKIIYIKTYQTSIASNVQIDVGSNLASFTVASSTSTALLSSFGILFVDATAATNTGAVQTGGLGTTQGIEFTVIATTLTDVTTASTVTITCPFTSAIDDFGIGVPSSAVKFSSGAAGFFDPTTGLTVAATTAYTLTPSSSSSTHGTFTVQGSIGTMNAGLRFLVIAGSTGSLTLPRVANNLATAYECRVAITRTSASTLRLATRFSISASALGTNTVSAPCTDVFVGMPVWVTFTPPATLQILASSTGYDYYVEFSVTITGGMASGLNPGTVTQTTADILSYAVDYPHDKSVSTTTTARFYVIGTTNYIAVKGLGGFTSTSTPPVVYFPLGGLAAGNLVVTTKTYYVLTADPRYQFVSHSSATTNTYTLTGNSPTSFASSGTAAPVVVGTSDQVVNGDAAVGMTLDIKLTTSNTSAHYYAVVLPIGYTWSTSKAIKNITAGVTTTHTGVYFFSSTTTAFAYPGVLVSTTVGTNQFTISASTAAGSFVIAGFQPIFGVPIANPSLRIVASGALTTCANSSTVTVKPQAGAITNVVVSPTSVKARGPDGINVKHVVSFTLTHGIPLGGAIILTFVSDWTSTGCSKCVATGLTAVAGGSISCVVATNTATVTGFADFSTTASSAITIEVNNLLAPSGVTTGATGTNFVSALVSATAPSSGLTIDSATTLTGTAVTVAATTTAGATTWTTKKTYPMNAGSTGVDLYLKFSLPHSLPKCGIITLTTPLTIKLTGTSVKNSCFLSPVQYNDCSLNGSNLQITLDSDYTGGSVLELFLDAAADNPTSVTTTTTGFSILSTWGGVTVDQDTGTVQTGQTFTATAALTSTITPSTTSGLSFAPKTAGEVATYTFDFKDSVNFAATDQFWIVFPPQFDYFLGDVWQWLTNEPNTYYIDCSSTQLGTTWCTVDHNIIVVTGSNAITGSTQIVINVQNVVNPIAGQTGAFQIYHVNANGDYLTVNQNYGTVTTVASAGNLDVRSLDQGTRQIFKSSDLKWRLYISDTMNTDSQLKVLFPREYDLSKVDKKDSYSCSSTWLDIAASATIKTQQNWNSASSCSASGNWVTLASPTASATFSATNIVTWTIQAVGNPQWGQTRSALANTQDFDVTDSVLWPIDPFWASKYTFFVYRSATANLAYTSRSYPNMNAAYASFYQGYRPLLVNSYGPQSKVNRIVVYAGTQTTDLYIATASASAPMAAKQVVLTPTTNSRTPDSGKLKYTSVVDSWTILESNYRIKFRVAAGIDMIKGLYYIDWANNETKQTGASDIAYDTPVSTLVEVIAKKSAQYTFSVATIPNISQGATSIPIKVSVTNAPHTDVTVNISVTGTPANISVNPTAITFGPDVNVNYFQIQVASNYDLTTGTSQTVALSLTGTDAYAFGIAATAKFTITQASTTITPGNVVSWGLGTATKTTISVTPSVDQIGVIYYQIAAAGAAIPTFSALKTSVPALVGQNSTTSTASTAACQTETSPQSGETWADFQYRLYKKHLATPLVGAISMFATTSVSTVAFSCLTSSTKYQLVGYLDNLISSSTDPTVHTEYFTTANIDDAQPFTVKFQDSVPTTYTTTIAQTASNVMGVDPQRLFNGTVTTSSSRELQTTTYTSFTYILVPNRFAESPAPSDQAKITGTALTTFTAALKTAGISNTLNGVANGASLSRVTPQWTSSPSTGGSTANSVTVSLRSNTAGRACCVALTGSATAPTPEQVMLGVDSTNQAASGACITTDLTATTNSVAISSLQAVTTYYVYCTATDNYPLWPTQMTYSTTNPLSSVSITTLGTVVDPNTTGASYFGGLFFLLAFLLH